MEKLPKNSQVDQRDMQIIRILLKDARTPVVSIAKQVGLSHDAVRYRINKLERKGVIRGYTLDLDRKKLGYDVLAIIMMSLWNYTPDQRKKFYNFLIKHKNVISVAKLTGDYDIKIAIMAEDPEHFDKIASEIKERFSFIIKGWSTFVFTKHEKQLEIPDA